MHSIVVAGGTGGVGRTIVEELLNVQKYRVTVLTRKLPLEQDRLEAEYRVAEYSDIDGLTKLLKEQQIHTVISAITILSEETSQSQLNLIKAAEGASTVQRFIPSEFGLVNTSQLLNLDPTIQYWIDAASALKQSRLMFTRFVNGFFMDYWAMPHVKSNLAPFVWAIDMQNCQACIPGKGDDFLSFTYSVDAAKLIVKALELDDWPEFSVIVGDEMSWNNFIELAEKARGIKFEVYYEDPKNFETGNIKTLTGSEEEVDQEMKDLWILFGHYTISGVFKMPNDNRLNQRFPEFKLKTVRELLDQAWKDK